MRLSPSRLLILAIAAILVGGIVHARRTRTTRRNLTPDPAAVSQHKASRIHSAAASGEFTLSGYDKPVNSRHESVIVTNTGSTDADSLLLTITYLDTQGRELHQRSAWIGGPFPAGATRQATFPSWDRQLSYRYRLSAPTRKQHTTYDIRISVDSLSTTTP